jgi:YfiH family protein
MIRSKFVKRHHFSDKYYNKNLLETIRGETPNNEKPLTVATMNQTHSNTVLKITDEGNYQSDGLLTSEKNLALVVKTADCMPVLIRDLNSIAAVHIGWRGLTNNIFNKTLELLQETELQVSIGPHARSCCYEVKQDVAVLLPELVETKDKKMYLNQAKSIENYCNENKIKIKVSDICTICDDNFFSFRENNTQERQLSFIWK